MNTVLKNIIDNHSLPETGFVIYEEYYLEEYYKAKHVILAVDSEDTAKELVKELNDVVAEMKKEYSSMCDFDNGWITATEKELNKKHLNYVDTPKWKAGLKREEITDEMRKERNDIRNENERRGEFNGKLHMENDAKRDEAYKLHAKTQNYKYSREQLVGDSLGFTPQFNEFGYSKVGIVKKDTI